MMNVIRKTTAVALMLIMTIAAMLAFAETSHAISAKQSINNGKSIYKSLRSAGYTKKGALSIVAAAKIESNVNPAASGTYGGYGVMQWRTGRLKNMKKKYPNGKYKKLTYQIKYMKYELPKYGNFKNASVKKVRKDYLRTHNYNDEAVNNAAYNWAKKYIA